MPSKINNSLRQKLDLSSSAVETAQALLGYELLFSDSRGERGGIIIEIEAYDKFDPASHSYSGQTLRNKAMFMPAGTIYLYKIYGIHLCLNIVCGQSDGQAVLIRALRPTQNLEQMRANRGDVSNGQICNGPAKLVQALGIPHDLNQKHLKDCSLTLIPPTTSTKIVATTRIGVTKATNKLWRFILSD